MVPFSWYSLSWAQKGLFAVTDVLQRHLPAVKPPKRHSWRGQWAEPCHLLHHRLQNFLECGISSLKILLENSKLSLSLQGFYRARTELWSSCFAASFPPPSLPCFKSYDDCMGWISWIRAFIIFKPFNLVGLQQPLILWFRALKRSSCWPKWASVAFNNLTSFFLFWFFNFLSAATNFSACQWIPQYKHLLKMLY